MNMHVYMCIYIHTCVDILLLITIYIYKAPLDIIPPIDRTIIDGKHLEGRVVEIRLVLRYPFGERKVLGVRVNGTTSISQML